MVRVLLLVTAALAAPQPALTDQDDYYSGIEIGTKT